MEVTYFPKTYASMHIGQLKPLNFIRKDRIYKHKTASCENWYKQLKSSLSLFKQYPKERDDNYKLEWFTFSFHG